MIGARPRARSSVPPNGRGTRLFRENSSPLKHQVMPPKRAHTPETSANRRTLGFTDLRLEASHHASGLRWDTTGRPSLADSGWDRADASQREDDPTTPPLRNRTRSGGFFRRTPYASCHERTLHGLSLSACHR